MSNLKQNGKLRWAPSFLRRQGKVTPGQKAAIRELWPRFGLTYQFGEMLDLKTAFANPAAPLVLEIGFGMGENLIHLAVTNPDTNFLGIEVHRPGIGAVLKSNRDAETPIENIRVMRGDARLILTDHLDAPTFDRVLVFFPDPWPKPGNDHRRLLQSDFIELIGNRLNPGGIFHVATDVSDYAKSVSELMERDFPNWIRQPEPEPNWERVASKYEQKGLANGHEIVDLIWRSPES